MVKSIKYIFTRILIGVGIALILMLLKGGLIANVNAQTIWTIDLGLTSMYDLNSTQNYDLPITNPIFVGRGRGYLTFNYYMTDYSDFANPIGNTTTAMPRYIYVTTTKNYNYICNIGSLGYQKESHPYYQIPNGSVSSGDNLAMTSTFSVTCDVELEEGEGIKYMHAANVGVQPNTFVQFSRYVTFVSDTNNAIKESQDKTNELIESDEVDTDKADSDIDNMKDKVASNGTITQLLTLPIQLFQKILNSVSGSCSPINLGSLWGHNLTLTCINLENILGSTLYNIIDILCCGLFILAFRKKMVDIFNHMTSLNDRGNELE